MCSKLKVIQHDIAQVFLLLTLTTSAHQYSIPAFLFVSSVRKTSHNVLKKQKAINLYRNKSSKAYFIQ